MLHQLELLDGVLADVFDRLVHAVGDEEQLQIRRAHGSGFHHILEQRQKPTPIGGPHQHHRKMQNFLRLDEGQRLVQLVERSQSARQCDERIGILKEEYFAYKEVSARDYAIAIAVRLLLERQHDVDAYRTAARLARTPIGGLHEAWPAACHHSKPKLRQRLSHLDAELIVRMPFANARRAEHSHARAAEMK